MILTNTGLYDTILANFEIKKLKLPMATIPPEQATQLLERLKKYNNESRSLIFDFSDKCGYMFRSSVGGTISYFSSWGLTPYLDIKVLLFILYYLIL